MRPHRSTLVLVGILLLLTLSGPGAVTAGSGPDPRVQAVAWVALVVGFTLVVWLRRRDQRAYEARLAAVAASRAVAEDRLALSRDLHDLVSGGLGAITVHAAVAQRLEKDPEGLRGALAEIERTGRRATADLRRMLAVLRGEETGVPTPSGTAPPRAPTATVTSVPAATPPVTAPPGAPTATVTSVEDLALRMVREALANTARHAGPGPVRVDVAAGAGSLGVRVTDAGPRPGWVPQPGSGYGLAGLRDQATALGGRLTAGASAQGDGFVLTLELPVPPGRVRP